MAIHDEGADAIACLDLMVDLGVKREHIYVVDSRGVIWEGRDERMEPNKRRYAQHTDARTLADVVKDADVFLGCSTAGVLTADMVKTMAPDPGPGQPPNPEIRPEVARAARPDCIIATGHSDYPNQINNALCFPFIFRGAMDAGATRITEEMKHASVKAIAKLARSDAQFGPEYTFPRRSMPG